MERVCIVGTAPSWKKTPWTDPGLTIVSLNDAYRMKGFKRADQWYDFHPITHFWSVPEGAQSVYAHQVPPGHYVRPADHVDWLRRQAKTIPVWLHPDCHTQLPETQTWPHAQPFPKAAIEAEFGHYFTSSPAWMLAHAMQQGARDIWVTGIHLATEHEYIEQRPNFEFLMGRLLGPHKIAVSEKDGMRHFETPLAHLALPVEAPIVASDFQYAFQPRPRAHLEPLKWEVHRYSVKRERALAALRDAPWWRPVRELQDEAWRAEACLVDAQEQLSRLQVAQQIGAL